MTIRLPLPVWQTPDAAPAPAPTPPAPAADPAAAPPAPGSALDLPDPAGDKPVATPADWPEDWRAKMAGGDAALAKRLERFTVPGEVVKSYVQLEGRMRSGKTATEAPDGTKDPEGLKAWREANGIPPDPTGYALPEDVTKKLTDADKPVLASFTDFAHKKNLPPGAVAVAAEWYVEQQQAAAEQTAAADKTAAEEVQDALRAEYGTEFRPNVTVAKRFAEEITPGVNWFEARMADGRKLGNIPEFVKALVDLGLQKYGDVAFAGGDAANATTTRKAELEKIRDSDLTAWDNNPAAKKEYFDILVAEDKRAGKK